MKVQTLNHIRELGLAPTHIIHIFHGNSCLILI